MSTGLRDNPWSLIRLRPAEGERRMSSFASRVIKELGNHVHTYFVQTYFHIDDPHL